MTVFAPDTLFDAPQAPVDFAFDERTVAVFPDMIHRSIPGYAALLQMTAAVARGVQARAGVFGFGDCAKARVAGECDEDGCGGGCGGAAARGGF